MVRSWSTSSLWLAILVLAAPGCVIVQPIVVNPMPNVTRVAVAPFVNHSLEPAVDIPLVTQAYFAELQKVPGFEVVPVAVTAAAIERYRLRMTGPEAALELARVLDVDAVVLGAITDYDPYEPPRIGMHVEWYSRRPPLFSPGVAVDPFARPGFWTRLHGRWQHAKSWVVGSVSDDEFEACPDGFCPSPRSMTTCDGVPLGAAVVRGQSQAGRTAYGPELGEAETFTRQASNQSRTVVVRPLPLPTPSPTRVVGAVVDDSEIEPRFLPPEPAFSADSPPAAEELRGPAPLPLLPEPLAGPDCPHSTALGAFGMPYGPVAKSFDPTEPILTYTRMFDAKDAQLLARLRDYVALNGDDRSGGWRAYLLRSEDFIRFTSHVMIAEMLTLYGGETRRRYVWRVRETE